MAAIEPRRSPDELARLGAEIYNRKIRPTLRPEDDDKFVAVDIDTGDHAIDEDDYAAVSRLRARNPAADVWPHAGRPPSRVPDAAGRMIGGRVNARREAIFPLL